MSKLKTLKIYGERNTGTNYLQQLLSENFFVNQIRGTAPKYIRRMQRFFPENEWLIDLYFSNTFSKNLGWKHSQVKCETLKTYELSKTVSFITLTKNPYSWLLSLYKRPYHQYYIKKPEFEEFINNPWKTVKRDNTKEWFNNPIDLWNIKNSSYIELKEDFPTINLRYEDLISDPEETFELIKTRFKLKPKKASFKNIIDSTKNDDRSYYTIKKYYLNEEWKKDLSDSSIMKINEYLDDDLLEYYSYKKIII